MTLVIIVLSVQAVLGALDNLIHHEIRARLPSRIGARFELTLHAVREAIYVVVFLALAWTRPEGLWAWGLGALLLVEIGVTIADFIEEERTRRLPPFERALHAVLAVGFGVFIAVLSPHLIDWAAQPTAIITADHGAWSWLLTVIAFGAGAWAIRNAIAVARLHRLAAERGPSPLRDAPTILVAGATGFIGTALVRALRAARQRVIVVARDRRQAAAQFGPDVLVVDDLDLLPAETRIDAIVNLAGARVIGWPWTRRRRRVLVASRVDTTKALIRLVARLETRPNVMVCASAIGFYGSSGDEPVDETAPPHPTFQSLMCRQREAASRAVETLGVRSVQLRIGLVLGHGGVFAPMALSARFGLGAILGRGRQMMSWIHVEDVVRLIRFAIATPALQGPVNATAPNAVTQGTFMRALARALRRPLWLRVPAFALRAMLGEQSQVLLEGQNVVPVAARRAGFWFRHPTIEMAIADLLGQAEHAPATEAHDFSL